MATKEGSYQIHSQARGAHWVAWVSLDSSGQPHESIVLVGETQEVAERNARAWAERLSRIRT